MTTLQQHLAKLTLLPNQCPYLFCVLYLNSFLPLWLAPGSEWTMSLDHWLPDHTAALLSCLVCLKQWLCTIRSISTFAFSTCHITRGGTGCWPVLPLTLAIIGRIVLFTSWTLAGRRIKCTTVAKIITYRPHCVNPLCKAGSPTSSTFPLHCSAFIPVYFSRITA